jgi:sugar phosphate isomerase/epimerase
VPHLGQTTLCNRRHLRPDMAPCAVVRRPYNDISMRIGVFTALLSKLPLTQVLDKLQSLNIHTVELGTGNYPGDPHCPLAMLTDRHALRDFKLQLEDRGFSISALSCHGNPLHPNAAIAKAFQETSRKTVRLAEKLGVPVVIDFSGCPGDSNHAKYPNWITCPWPPEYLEVLEWQWEKKVAPFWTRHAQFTADHGVKIAIEMHPGFVAYSPETLLKLRSIAGQNIGCNYDPSHMFLAGHRSDCSHSGARRFYFSCARQGHPDVCRQSAEGRSARYQEIHR